MSWKQLYLKVAKEHAESVSDWLTDQGAQAITFADALDKAIFEPPPGETPLWDTVILSALFEQNDAVENILQHAKQQFPHLIEKCRIKTLADQDWERVWMKDFKAMKFGNKLWICPSWQTPPEPEAINIILDPGLAFGSGTHETTSLCLKWLDSIPLQGKTVIDYGCGSGVLAIASIKLGARSVLATDTDEQALIATRENASRNHLTQNRLKVIKVDANTPAPFPPTAILIANILAEPLRMLAPYLASLTQADGQIGLSGILTTQAAEISTIYSQWFEMSATISDGDWSFISGIKK